jgi:hypothetical protein
MLNLNDIKNLLQNNKITEFVKLNKLSSRDIIEFTNRYTNWAGKLFSILILNRPRVFKYLRKKQEIIIKSCPMKRQPNCSMPRRTTEPLFRSSAGKCREGTLKSWHLRRVLKH